MRNYCKFVAGGTVVWAAVAAWAPWVVVGAAVGLVAAGCVGVLALAWLVPAQGYRTRRQAYVGGVATLAPTSQWGASMWGSLAASQPATVRAPGRRA